MNNCNNNNNSSSNDALSWAIVIICLVAFWPLGLFLLLRKISFNAKKNPSKFTGSNFRPGQAPWQSNQTSSYYRPGSAQQPQQTQQYQQTQQTQQHQQTNQPPQSVRPASQAQQSYTPYRAPQKAQAQGAQQGYYNAQVNRPAQKNQAGKKQKKAKEKKQSGKGLAAFLTFLGILFSAIGIGCVASGVSISMTAGMDGSALGTLLVGIFFCLGGVISFTSRIGIMARIRKCNKYSAILGDREVMSVTDMAKSAGISVKKLRKELIEIADYGYFGESAYFDTGLDSICLSSTAAEKVRTESARTSEAAEKPVGSDNQYVAIINELHMLCGKTIDPSICSKIHRIEEVTAKIFRIVEEKPEKAPQIRRFMNYYLPTTLKLLHSYEMLEKQGVSGENIMSAKQDIERVLDTLAAGFEQQLDNLFRADAIDISADINVLENLMEQDGLTNEGNIMKTSDGSNLKTSESNILKMSDGSILKTAGGN